MKMNIKKFIKGMFGRTPDATPQTLQPGQPFYWTTRWYPKQGNRDLLVCPDTDKKLNFKRVGEIYEWDKALIGNAWIAYLKDTAGGPTMYLCHIDKYRKNPHKTDHFNPILGGLTPQNTNPPKKSQFQTKIGITDTIPGTNRQRKNPAN